MADVSRRPDRPGRWPGARIPPAQPTLKAVIHRLDDHGVTGVITASEPSWTAPFSGLSRRCFGKEVTSLRSIDADSRLVAVVGRPLPGDRNDCKAWHLCGAKDAVGKTTVIADGAYRGTGLVIPHRRERGQTELPAWKEEHNASHRKVRARVERAFARMNGKVLRDCRRAGIPCEDRRAAIPCEDQETEPPDGGAACADHGCFALSGGSASRRWSWRRALVVAGGVCRNPG